MIKKLPSIAFLLLSGCAASAPHDQAVSRVSVTFVEPEKFTDSRRVEFAPTSAGILRQLERFLMDAGARYVPETMKLSIRVTDIDLAGYFESFRGPQADQVRITKGLYPPRIVLEFELLDSGAKIIQKGKRHLTLHRLPITQCLPERRLPAV